MSQRRRRWSTAAIATAAAALGAAIPAACASDAAAPDTTPSDTTPSDTTPSDTTTPRSAAPVQHLAVEVVAPRYLGDAPRVAVAVTNTGSEPIVVTEVALRADHYEHVDPEPKRSTIRPGSRVDLQVDVGPIRACESAGPLAAAAHLVLAGSPGEPAMQHLVSVETTALDQRHRIGCGRALVASTVTVEFSSSIIVDAGTLRTAIEADVIDRSRSVRIERIRGTEVFALLPSDEAGLPADALSLPVDVELFVTRCDEHVLAASTRTFEFKVWVRVDDRDPHLVVLDPPPPLEQQLRALVAACVTERR